MKKTILLEKKYLYVKAQKGFVLTGVSTETFPVQTGFYLFHVENVAEALGNSYVDVEYQDDDASFSAFCSDLFMNEVQSSPVVAVENLEDAVTAGFTGVSDAMSVQNQNLVNILSSLSDSDSTSFEKLFTISDTLGIRGPYSTVIEYLYQIHMNSHQVSDNVDTIKNQNGFMEDAEHPLKYFYQWFPNVLPWGFGQGVSDAMSVQNQNLVNILSSLSDSGSTSFEKLVSIADTLGKRSDNGLSISQHLNQIESDVYTIRMQEGFMEDAEHPSMYFYKWFPNVLPWGFGQGVSDAMSVLNQNLVNLKNNQSYEIFKNSHLESCGYTNVNVEGVSYKDLNYYDSFYAPRASGSYCFESTYILNGISNLRHIGGHVDSKVGDKIGLSVIGVNDDGIQQGQISYTEINVSSTVPNFIYFNYSDLVLGNSTKIIVRRFLTIP